VKLRRDDHMVMKGNEGNRLEERQDNLQNVNLVEAIFDEGIDLEVLDKFKEKARPHILAVAKDLKNKLQAKAILLAYYLELSEAEPLLIAMFKCANRSTRKQFFAAIDALRLGIEIKSSNMQRELVCQLIDTDVASLAVKALGLFENLSFTKELVTALENLAEAENFDNRDWALYWLLDNEVTAKNSKIAESILLSRKYQLNRWTIQKALNFISKSDCKNVKKSFKSSLLSLRPM